VTNMRRQQTMFPKLLKHLPIMGSGRWMLLAAIMVVAPMTVSAQTIEIWRSRNMGRFGDNYFRVSVGSRDKMTPTGRYTVRKKQIDYWSRKYDRAMPYAVFFTDAHAIHAGDLTTPSKGCIRVDYPTAEWLYYYAKSGKTRVVIHP
jgi:lipoprotein-anchoring transpeptidase ErfK/SrfK